jgi:hypothetical protein
MLMARVECIPNSFYDDDPEGEESRLLKLLISTFPDAKLPEAIPTLPREPNRDHFGKFGMITGEGVSKGLEFNIDYSFYALEKEFKGFFCKSQKCSKTTEDNEDGPGKWTCDVNFRGLDVTDIPIPIHAFLEKWAQMGRQMEALEKFNDTTCSYLPDGTEFVIDQASYQLNESETPKEAYMCLIAPLAPCFPRNKNDIRKFAEWEAVNTNLVESGVMEPIEKGSKKHTACERLQDWFCWSGFCEEGQCTTGTRKDSTLKWWLENGCNPEAPNTSHPTPASTQLLVLALTALTHILS